MGVAAKHSSMVFYSDAGNDHYSQRVRIVLAEKGVVTDIIDADPNNMPEDLADLNPYHSLPTLIDRDLVLYQPQVIMEYLDERFPHPPLLPVYPVFRAQSRLYIYRIQRDWCGTVDAIVAGKDTPAKLDMLRKELRESLTSIAPIFNDKPYFMSDEFSLVDACVAPILWRLPNLKIELPKQAKPMFDYMQRIFSRDAFQASLSETELDMRS